MRNSIKYCLYCKSKYKKHFKESYRQWINRKFCSHRCSAKVRERKIKFECQSCHHLKILTYRQWNVGGGGRRRKYCSRKCRDLSKKGIIPINVIRDKVGFKKGHPPFLIKIPHPTSIEKKVYQELKKRGLLFEKQKWIGNRFRVDVYIPSLNLVIECDGDYWHSLPKAIIQDKIKNDYFIKQGFNLLRLSETEINNGSFKRKLPKF